ncbi:MAG: hypothetical protein IJW31_09155 [Lentisphaeria bacterium]|nr:hypothetical protein [Lentisphaeria bacterium]
MFKRFLRHNKMLAAVLAVTAVLVLVLFVILVIQYIAMSRANNKVQEMRKTIEDLLNPRKHKVAAVEGNLDLIAQDKAFYTEKLKQLKAYFGNPYYDAVDAMSKHLVKTIKTTDEEGNVKTSTGKYVDGNDLIEDFNLYVKENTSEPATDRLKRFAKAQGRAWDTAMAEFIKLANKASFEAVDENNCDEFFLVAVGFPRDRGYASENVTRALIANQKENMHKYLINNQVVVDKEAAEFALNLESGANKEAVADLMFNMDIAGYLVKTIGSTAHNVKRLQLFSFVGKEESRNIQGIMVNHYKLIVSGNLESLRELTKQLNESYKDKRVLKIKNAKLHIPSDLDDGARIINITEQKEDNSAQNNQSDNMDMGGGIFGTGRNRQQVVEQPKEDKPQTLDVFDESELPYYERTTYGELILGGSDDVTMEMDLDYYYLKK